MANADQPQLVSIQLKVRGESYAVAGFDRSSFGVMLGLCWEQPGAVARHGR